MIDPMAGIADSGNSGPGDATGGEGKDVFDMAAFQLNLKKMDKIRSFMGIVSGCAAGILGLTSLSGLGAFNVNIPFQIVNGFVSDVIEHIMPLISTI